MHWKTRSVVRQRFAWTAGRVVSVRGGLWGQGLVQRGMRWVFVLLGWPVFWAGCESSQEPEKPREPLSVWLEQAKSEDSGERVIALQEFVRYPEQAADLFYPLMDGIVHPDSVVKAAAAKTITALAEPLAEHAAGLLDSDDPKVLAAACDMLSRTGTAGRIALPKILAMAASDSTEKQTYALFAARNLESDNPELMATAARFLESENFQNQVIALDILRGYGPAANSAAGQIKSVAENGNPSARIHALEALGAVGPVAEFDMVEFLIGRLDVFLQPEREAALKGLGRLGTKAIAAREPVERMMHDFSKSNQVQAALAYWRITGDARETRDFLTDLGEIGDYEEDAVFALAEMGAAAQPAADFVAGKLESEDESFRLAVLDVLERIDGVSAARAKIRKLAKSDPDVLVRRRASELLK